MTVSRMGSTQRYDIRGRLLREKIHVTKCAECGMGLVDAAEYHPYEACVIFKRTHDSGDVLKALHADPRRPWA